MIAAAWAAVSSRAGRWVVAIAAAAALAWRVLAGVRRAERAEVAAEAAKGEAAARTRGEAAAAAAQRDGAARRLEQGRF